MGLGELSKEMNANKQTEFDSVGAEKLASTKLPLPDPEGDRMGIEIPGYMGDPDDMVASTQSMHIFTFSHEGGLDISIPLAKVNGCISRREGGVAVHLEGDYSESPYVVPSYHAQRFHLEWEAFRIRIDQHFWRVCTPEEVIKAAEEMNI